MVIMHMGDYNINFCTVDYDGIGRIQTGSAVDNQSIIVLLKDIAASKASEFVKSSSFDRA